MKDKRLQELEQSFATIMDDFKKIKADMGMDTETETDTEDDDMDEKMTAMMDYTMRAFANLSDRISYLSDGFSQYAYDHNKGHLPPIKSASTMAKALKALGLEGDYEINKPWISVASKHGNLNVTASFKKNERT